MQLENSSHLFVTEFASNVGQIPMALIMCILGWCLQFPCDKFIKALGGKAIPHDM